MRGWGVGTAQQTNDSKGGSEEEEEEEKVNITWQVYQLQELYPEEVENKINQKE